MKKYQISEEIEMENTAGGKAPNDVDRIAAELGYQGIYIHRFVGKKGEVKWLTSRVHTIYEWLTRLKLIQTGSILLVQLPIRYNLNLEYGLLKKLKKKDIKIIGFVHDVEKLRTVTKRSHFERDFQFMVNDVDALIVHNEVMKDYFISKGVPESKLITLGIFDYLDSKTLKKKYSGAITIAGNLDPQKARYISKLKDIEEVRFNLFGPNYSNEIAGNNIRYMGKFPPDQLYKYIAGTFGLVWDGEAIDDCIGVMGNYLRYNNPHKLSLYLSSGIPVVVWDKSAEARFVKENEVGICVSSLYELKDIMNTITQEQYEQYVSKVEKVSEKLSKGYYTKLAIHGAEEIVGY